MPTTYIPNRSYHQTNKSQFSDDPGKWTVSKSIDLAEEYLQKDLDKLARWCAKWKIKLNPEKTKVIIFRQGLKMQSWQSLLYLYMATSFPTILTRNS